MNCIFGNALRVPVNTMVIIHQKIVKCLKTYMNDIWELERIELVPLNKEQLKELG
jgi:hypothetical protein